MCHAVVLCLQSRVAWDNYISSCRVNSRLRRRYDDELGPGLRLLRSEPRLGPTDAPSFKFCPAWVDFDRGAPAVSHGSRFMHTLRPLPRSILLQLISVLEMDAARIYAKGFASAGGMGKR